MAHATSRAVATPWAFLAAILTVIIWVSVGPAFHYSDTWQLVINTGTTIVTFLMVFLIQNTQNRDARVLQLKVDELLRAIKAARTELVGMEELEEKDLDRLQSEFRILHDRAAAGLERIDKARAGKAHRQKADSAE